MLYESINIPLWRALRDMQGLRVLDIGCGTGALGELLRRNGNVVTGLTRSPEEAKSGPNPPRPRSIRSI